LSAQQVSVVQAPFDVIIRDLDQTAADGDYELPVAKVRFLKGRWDAFQ
jgi:hypothetical protein